MNSLSNDLRNAQQALLDTVRLVEQYGSEEQKDPTIYLKMMEDLCAINQDAKYEMLALDAAEKAETVEEVDRIYKSEMNKRSEKPLDHKLTPEYQDFKRKVEEILCPSVQNSVPVAALPQTHVENDELVMDIEITKRDPLTKKFMKNPVRNKLCGHRYERSTILEYLRVKSDATCPVTGCANKQVLQKKQLVIDEEFKKYIIESTAEADDE